MATLKELYDKALKNGMPTFLPLTPYADDRGWSHMDVFSDALTLGGQVNFSEVASGVIKAWHRHQNQTDFWVVVRGMLKCVVFRESPANVWKKVVGVYNPGILIIPKGLWHGCVNTTMEPAGLLYYVDKRYNTAQPDEVRRPWDWPEPINVGGAWYGIEHK